MKKSQVKKQEDRVEITKEEFENFVKALASVKPDDKLKGKSYNPTAKKLKQVFIYRRTK